MPSERDGDFVAFATARTPTLFRLALLLTGEWYAAEDLVQDTLATVFRRWGRVAAAANPAAYARATLVNTHLSGRRRRSSTERPVAEPDPGLAPEADPALRATLLAALAELGVADRAVVVLRYWEDLDVAATAELVGSTPNAVRARCHRAIARLRDLLGDDLHELRAD